MNQQHTKENSHVVGVCACVSSSILLCILPFTTVVDVCYYFATFYHIFSRVLSIFLLIVELKGCCCFHWANRRSKLEWKDDLCDVFFFFFLEG